MKKKITIISLRTLAFLACLLWVLSPGLLGVDVPTTISYQGKLTDSGGNPINGTMAMVFKILDQMTAVLWQESHEVTVTNGIFEVGLGTMMPLPPLVFSSSQCFLEVTVNGERLDPRQPLRSVPYAMKADTVSDSSVNNNSLADDAVTAEKIGHYTIVAENIQGETIGGDKIVNDALGADQIQDIYVLNTGDDMYGALTVTADTGIGVSGSGQDAGGYFVDTDGGGNAYVGYAATGVMASGDEYGGNLKGTTAGGHFEDLDETGRANVAIGNTGISASGSYMGGMFEDSDGTATAHVGAGVSGVDATGDSWGILARGDIAGGHFENPTNDATADLAASWGIGLDATASSYGVQGQGYNAGGNFADRDSGTWADVGADVYKINGTGSVNFIQNHPEDKTKVIVYAAPEGDEVATYTRGTARLVNGEAIVPLGETFKWVTNPDIGLTVHLTPIGEPVLLCVAKKSTEEIVVKAPQGSPDIAFDYIVYGLRIGFEETTVVQDKSDEAFIPGMKSHHDRCEKDPSLKKYRALDRYKTMEAEVKGKGASVDLSRSKALKEAIHEFDPKVDKLPKGRQDAPKPQGAQAGSGNGS